MIIPGPLYPSADAQLSRKRRELAPDTAPAFAGSSRQLFADGALAAGTKQLIAVAVAHVTQSPYCIRGHTRGALRAGVSETEIIEAVWVAAELRACGSYAHSIIALSKAEQVRRKEHPRVKENS